MSVGDWVMVIRRDLVNETDELVREVARKLSDQLEENPVKKEKDVEQWTQWKGQRWNKYNGEDWGEALKQDKVSVEWKGQAWTKYA